MKDIVVEYRNEVTINIGNFENVKPGYTVRASVSEGEDVNSVRAKIKARVDGWLEEDIKEHKDN
jgi:hypothetical protein